MAQTTSLVFNGGVIPSPTPVPSGTGKAKLLKIGEITITEQGVQVTKNVICDPDSVTSVAPFMEVITSTKLAELVEANSVLVLNDGSMQYLMADATITVEDETAVCTSVSFLGLSKEHRAKVTYPCTRVTDELTLQQVIEVGEPVETAFNLVSADSEDMEPGTLIDKLEVVDNVRDHEYPDDPPLLQLETTVDGQGNRKVGINEDNLQQGLRDIGDAVLSVIDTLDSMDFDEVPHGSFGSSLNQSPGDGTTTSIQISIFRPIETTVGDAIAWTKTTEIGGEDFGTVTLEPGTYIICSDITCQWVGVPAGTYLPQVGNVLGEPFDFSQPQELHRRLTNVVTVSTTTQFKMRINFDAATPVMGFWINSAQIVKIAGGMSQTNVTHDSTLTGQGSVADPLGVNTQNVVQSTLAGNVAPAFVPNVTVTVRLACYAYGGTIIQAKEDGYQGEFTLDKFDIVPATDFYRTLGVVAYKNLPGVVLNNSIVVENGVNQFDQSSNAIKDGYFITTTGSYMASTGYWCSHPIFVAKGFSYSFRVVQSSFGGNKVLAYVSDVDFETVTDVIEYTETDNLATFTAPKDGYIRFSGAGLKTNIMFAFSDIYPNSYVGYQPRKLARDIKVESEIDASQIKNIVDYKNLPKAVLNNGVVTVNGINQFNQFNDAIKDGYYITSAGLYYAATGYWCSHPIFVAKGFAYSFKVRQSSFGGNKVLAYVSEVDFATVTDVVTYTESDNLASFVAPKDGYIRFSGAGIKTDIMFTFTSIYPNSYVEYRPRKLASDISTSKLTGKKLSCIGDSICYGDGYVGGYCKIIGDTYGMTWENLGVSGAHVSGYDNHVPLVDRISGMSDDADYVLVEGGVNDHDNTNIGALTIGYEGPFDVTSEYGAFEKLWHDLYIKYPGKKIAYVAVHKVNSHYNSQYYAESDNIYKIAIETCKKWGIPICDLNISCPPFAYFSRAGSAFNGLFAGFTKNNDGWHPTEEGYKKYYVPKIVPFLESL